jgi:type IV pilus biogenesis protein CpaD/CtpE
MRRAVLIAACLAAIAFACRTTQPPGTENQLPIDTPGQEPIQTVPSEPPGPAGPLTAPMDGGTPG